ncbi:MAG: ribosome silencing factor [Thermoanaerobaculia bacterium]
MTLSPRKSSAAPTRPADSEALPSPRRTAVRATPADIQARVREAVAAAHDTKAENVRVRHLEPVTSFTDYFVIASATNERQVQAIANAVEDRLLKQGVKPLHIEGYTSAQWVLLDYGDFLVHALLEERRDYYALERLWRDAPEVTADFAPPEPAS